MAGLQQRYPVTYQPYGSAQYITQLQNTIAYYQNEMARLQQEMQNAASQVSGQTDSPQPVPLGAPIRNVDIISISSKQEMKDYELEPDAAGMFMMDDDSIIFIKTVSKNGEVTVYPYVRGEAEIEKPFNPNDYIRKDELMAMRTEQQEPDLSNYVRKDEVAQMIAAAMANRGKKEVMNNGAP